MAFAKELIRGIMNSDQMAGDYADASLFKNFEAAEGRNDGFLELSINWYDDIEALTSILHQKKDNGELQYKVGAAILPRKIIDEFRKRPIAKDRLAYERKAEPGNDYHGNLLLKEGVSKKERNIIASGIASCVDRIEIANDK
jgi:hypothetical protein